MDKFKQKQNLYLGGGGYGIHCYCCNPFFGKRKPILNRIARTNLKKDTKKELDDEFKFDYNYEKHYG